MNNQIILQLKTRIDEVSVKGIKNVEIKRNVLKEELQYYMLNFIYHHPLYSEWTMYGGSALRICHKLDRMSVDLDFEIKDVINDAFLKKLSQEIGDYFTRTYNTDSSFLTIKENKNRGIRLNFNLGKELELGHTSDLVHIKVDLNCFTAPKTVTERIPINHNQFSFVIKTYNMSNLMASKIAAIFLRGQRGVGSALYEEKGRDIYDLLWYMNKKIIPDLDYLKAKGVDVSDVQSLFNKLTLKMNDVSEENLKNDLVPLFFDQNFISDWLKNWMNTYLYLLNDYKINTISKLEKIKISQNFQTGDFSFIFTYETVENKSIKIIFYLSDRWLEKEIQKDNADIDNILEISEKIWDLDKNIWRDDKKTLNKLKEYAKIFKEKIELYFKKTKRVVIGDTIATKLIRCTADNLNRNEEIVLTLSALISCELDDLFK